MFQAYLHAVTPTGIKIQYTDGTSNIFEDVALDRLTTKQDLIDYCTAKIDSLNTKQTKESNLLTALQSLIGKKIV